MCTIRLLQQPFLSNCLTDFARRLSKLPDYDIVEASLLDPSIVEHALDDLLTSIETALPRIHAGIPLVCRIWHNAVKKKFSGSELAAVGGIFFLRFMCPVLSTAATSQQSDLPSHSDYVKHKQLVLLAAKIVLGICNQITVFKEVCFSPSFPPQHSLTYTLRHP
jgi:hypothetical protein